MLPCVTYGGMVAEHPHEVRTAAAVFHSSPAARSPPPALINLPPSTSAPLSAGFTLASYFALSSRAKGEPVYLEKAQVYLSSLMSSTYFDPTASDGWEALLRKSCAAWGEASTGSVTGDYFFLETLASVHSASFFLATPFPQG